MGMVSYLLQRMVKIRSYKNNGIVLYHLYVCDVTLYKQCLVTFVLYSSNFLIKLKNSSLRTLNLVENIFFVVLVMTDTCVRV